MINSSEQSLISYTVNNTYQTDTLMPGHEYQFILSGYTDVNGQKLIGPNTSVVLDTLPGRAFV